MLHVKKRRPGDLNGSIFPSQEFTWYNPGNKELTEKFNDLAELETAKPKLRLALLLPAGILAGCIGLSIFGEYRAISAGLGALAALLLGLPLVLRSWATSVYRDNAQEISKQINAGTFGWDFMPEDDPLWEILEDLFGQHDINMFTDLFNDNEVDAAIAPELAKLLRRTADARLTMRRRQGLVNTTSAEYLHVHAAAVVPEMVATYRDLRPRT